MNKYNRNWDQTTYINQQTPEEQAKTTRNQQRKKETKKGKTKEQNEERKEEHDKRRNSGKQNATAQTQYKKTQPNIYEQPDTEIHKEKTETNL